MDHIYREKQIGKLALEDEFRIGGISYGEKGPHLKKFSGGPILKIEIFNAFLFIF